MTEEQATQILEDKGYTNKDIVFHLQRIRMQSKGYWSEPDAKAYMEALK